MRDSLTFNNSLFLTVHGHDAPELSYISASVNEQVDSLFEIELEALSDDPEGCFDDLIGAHITLSYDLGARLRAGPMAGDTVRQFDGIVISANVTEQSAQGQSYRMRLVPWLAFAERRTQQRIFHNKTCEEILREVFDTYTPLGDGLYRFELHDQVPTLEYTVQYGESDLNFARRILERFGLSFYFEHHYGVHTMVIFDSTETFGAMSGPLPLMEIGQGSSDFEQLRSWRPVQNQVSEGVRLVDYDFKEPNKALEFDRLSTAPGASTATEMSIYPGDYLNDQDGKRMVRRHLDAQSAGRKGYQAQGFAPSLGPGVTICLDAEHWPEFDGGEFSCMGAQHRLPTLGYGTGQGQVTEYVGQYRFVPAKQPHAPRRATPPPVMRGPQTAVVVAGPSGGGDEVECDEHGRIWVRYHWDLTGANSMPCRVSQSWAGGGWGHMVIPRIGMEVIVEHIDGNPDHPIVTGCLYNGKNKPPYGLPANKTRSTFKSDSHKSRGFNELRFEDKGGAEEIFLHAEKDLNSRVKKDRTERVQEDKIESVGGHKASEVDKILLQTVGQAMQLQIGASHRNTVTPTDADERESLAERGHLKSAFDTALEDGRFVLITDGDWDTRVKKNRRLEVEGEEKVDVTLSAQKSVGMSEKKTVGTDFTLEANTSITLKCGTSEIKMTPSGIKIKGVMTKIEGQAKMDVKGAMTTVSGTAMTTVKSSGVTAVKGGILKLN